MIFLLATFAFCNADLLLEKQMRCSVHRFAFSKANPPSHIQVHSYVVTPRVPSGLLVVPINAATNQNTNTSIIMATLGITLGALPISKMLLALLGRRLRTHVCIALPIMFLLQVRNLISKVTKERIHLSILVTARPQESKKFISWTCTSSFCFA